MPLTELTFTQVTERQIRWLVACGDEAKAALIAVDLGNRLLRAALADSVPKVEHDRIVSDLHHAYRKRR